MECLYTSIAKSQEYPSRHLPYQLRNVLKMKHHVNSSCYGKRKIEKEKSWLIAKLSEFYTTELVDSYFHLCGRGYHHDHVDVDALTATTADVDENPVALYLRDYDWSLSRQLYMLDLRIVCIFCRLLYMACVACNTFFV